MTACHGKQNLLYIYSKAFWKSMTVPNLYKLNDYTSSSVLIVWLDI